MAASGLTELAYDGLWATLAAAYLGMATVASFFVIDLGAGLVFFLARVANLPRLTRIRWRSATLRSWMRIFIGHLEVYGRCTMVVTGDTFLNGESALVVANHRSWLDTIAMYSLARQVNADGDLKFLAKSGLLLFPVYGAAGAILEVVIFIQRTADGARAALARTYDALSSPDRHGHPFWMVSYLEGTRRTRAKLHDAQQYARDKRLRELSHVLQPRTKGFVTSVQELRHCATAVYDITIGYHEADTPDRDIEPSFLRTLLTPSLTDRPMYIHQRRIPIANLPHDEKELKKWVYKLYEEKDDLLKHFAETKRFPGRTVAWKRVSVANLAVHFVGFWATFMVVWKIVGYIWKGVRCMFC